MSPGRLWGREKNLGPGSTKIVSRDVAEGALLILAGVEERKRETIKSVYWLSTHLPALFSNQTQIDTGIATLYI